MKIYTKFVSQWQPDGSLLKVPEECESFEYEGPIAHCGDSIDRSTGIGAQYMFNPIGAQMNDPSAAKNRQPPMPDYIGAANAQSYGSIGAALANNQMSHPNISTPLGSQTWNQTGNSAINIPGLGNINIPQYSQTISLSPDQQKLYDQQTKLADTTQTQAQSNLSQPQDMNSAQAIADKAYSNYTSRLDPQWAARSEANDAQLANQGITRGSEAYTNAQRDFNNARNDAYTQANTAAINTMPQTYQLATAARDQPLNEMNALKTGSQVNMPQFQPSQYPGNAQGPNTLNATQGMAGWQQGLYNQQVAQQNSQTQGAFGLGSAAMMAFL